MQTLQTQTGTAQTEVPMIERKGYEVGTQLMAKDFFEPHALMDWRVAKSNHLCIVLIRSDERGIREQCYSLQEPTMEELKPWSARTVQKDQRVDFTNYQEILGRAA